MDEVRGKSLGRPSPLLTGLLPGSRSGASPHLLLDLEREGRTPARPASPSHTEVVEIIDRYDHACVPPNMTDNKLAYIQNEAISRECTRTLTVTKDTKQPIYAYYQLDNFYQNHRRVRILY
ncbi:hypothetical protein VPH35_008912 [Triticum aestivum]